ncbi:hypothetical protein ACQP3L_38015, partial [Escherichia coli]
LDMSVISVSVTVTTILDRKEGPGERFIWFTLLAHHNFRDVAKRFCPQLLLCVAMGGTGWEARVTWNQGWI